MRLAGRIAFARYWSIFGATNIDLTGAADDPTSTLSGFQPVRHRLGLAYEDDCVQLGFTWRRDYQTSGDARRGNSFQLRLVFKNLVCKTGARACTGPASGWLAGSARSARVQPDWFKREHAHRHACP